MHDVILNRQAVQPNLLPWIHHAFARLKLKGRLGAGRIVGDNVSATRVLPPIFRLPKNAPVPPMELLATMMTFPTASPLTPPAGGRAVDQSKGQPIGIIKKQIVIDDAARAGLQSKVRRIGKHVPRHNAVVIARMQITRLIVNRGPGVGHITVPPIMIENIVRS